MSRRQEYRGRAPGPGHAPARGRRHGAGGAVRRRAIASDTVKVWIAHERGLSLMGDLPTGVQVEVFAGDPDALPSDPDTVQVWAPPFLSSGPVVALAEKMPALRLVQLMSAGADAWVGRLRDDVTLCDARGVHDSSTSEWTLTAVLSYLHRFPAFARAQARREWAFEVTDELVGKRVLVVGAGSIGTAIARRLAPFEVTVTMVARRPREGVHGVSELPALLPHADIVVLVVPLTPQTRGLVDAAFLAAMPDRSLLVNAARGPVVDTDALTAALADGRIAAAVDVTDPEPLPTDHPLWTMPNVLLTPHVAGSVRGLMPRAYRLVGAQLRRYCAGEPLDNIVVDGY
jgi:phosphoglycerate dehydrogenase-like enzyme